MRRLFHTGIALTVLFELANVWFIMPLPYSQRLHSIDVAYALYSWRWPVRVVAGALIVAGLRDAWRVRDWRRWLSAASLAVAGFIAYVANFRMRADRMFLAPTSLRMVSADRNEVDLARLVVGIEIDGEPRAYPVQFIGYHHQVRDTIAGTPVLVTYCTVCRTGRVFSPVVDGRIETFRLVGMDHFNAMFEDPTTGTWWRQVSGEAAAGPKKGATLAELPSRQMTLARWLALHPRSLVMQADTLLRHAYYQDFDYETGASRKALTGTDTISWSEKAWVVGISVGKESRAYDWNRLRRERIVNDMVGGRPIVILLASDDASFVAYERPDTAIRFQLRNDSLVSPTDGYDLGGRGSRGKLPTVSASQEFWHSWRTFHPTTTRW
jgi:hypothetical protein